MKKIFFLSVAISISAQAHADYSCSINKDIPVFVDGKETSLISKNVRSQSAGITSIYQDDINAVEVSINEEKQTLLLVSYDRKSLEIQAMATADLSADQLSLSDVANHQKISCLKRPTDISPANLGISVKYIRMSNEGGGPGPVEPPKTGGCWIISCAH